MNVLLNVCMYLWMYTVYLRRNVVHHRCVFHILLYIIHPKCEYIPPGICYVYLDVCFIYIYIYLRTQACVCSFADREETTVNTFFKVTFCGLVYDTTSRFNSVERQDDR
jgi:hypothetical protein